MQRGAPRRPPRRCMGQLVALCSVALVITLASCGGGDDERDSTAPSVEAGQQGPTVATLTTPESAGGGEAATGGATTGTNAATAKPRPISAKQRKIQACRAAVRKAAARAAAEGLPLSKSAKDRAFNSCMQGQSVAPTGQQGVPPERTGGGETAPPPTR
jgi:hypothetical protein